MLAAWRAGPELEMMRRIKRALDPDGLLNPGKVLARL
jgi:FAD/FMN-containing dehydrogenase